MRTKVLHSIDIGNGDIKATSTRVNNTVIYPAVVGKLNLNNADSIIFDSDEAKKLQNMSLQSLDRGEVYAIGDMALKNSAIRNHNTTDDKYLSDESEILIETALSLNGGNSAVTEANVILALPLHKLEIVSEIERRFKGKTFNSKIGFFGHYDYVKKTIISDIKVIGQPYGTLFNLILDSNGNIVNKDLAKSGLAIFDIGYKTNDGIVFRNLEPISRLKIASKNGMYVAYEEIRREISKKFNGLDLRLFDIPQIIKSGTIRGVDIENIIDEAFYNLSYNIILEVKNSWEGAWEIDNIVFTGGGSELLQPYLSQAFEAIFPQSPRISNAEGLLKYANRLWREEVWWQ